MATTDDPADARRYAEISDRLVTTVGSVVGPWIERLVYERVASASDRVPGPLADPDDIARRAAAAGAAAQAEASAALRRLVDTDVDDQRENPLAILRSVTGHAHRVLAELGVPAVHRDHFAVGSFPDDVYGLVPAAWSDVHEELHEPGMMWSAAKAYLFTSRRKREGRT